MSLDFGPIQTLGFAVLVLYIGMYLISRLRFLSDNNIPVPVVGGFLFFGVRGIFGVLAEIGQLAARGLHRVVALELVFVFL